MHTKLFFIAYLHPLWQKTESFQYITLTLFPPYRTIYVPEPGQCLFRSFNNVAFVVIKFLTTMTPESV